MFRSFTPSILLAILGSPAYAETWSVTATNPSDWMRPQSTVEVLLPIQSTGSPLCFTVRPIGETKPLKSQILTSNLDQTSTRIIFQSIFMPRESRNFIIESACSSVSYPYPKDSTQDPPDDALQPQTFARFVPERLDDFAWENDKVAFRMYGPALASQNGGSGIDCWLKRVSYPIINKWYEQHLRGISYHIDHGEGYDPYHVGQSRGCGGLSYVIGNTFVSSSVFQSYQIINRGPLRTTFQLRYSTKVDNLVVNETKTANLDLGSHFTDFLVDVSANNKPAPFPISIGLNTHENHGEGFIDPEKGVLSVWEKFDDSFLGTGIVTPPKMVKEMQIFQSTEKDKAHVYGITHQNPTGRYQYATGYGWVKADTIQNQEQWIALLNRYQSELLEPLKITLNR